VSNGGHDSGTRLRREDEDIDALVSDLVAQVANPSTDPDEPSPMVMSYIARAKGRRFWQPRWAWGLITPLDPETAHDATQARMVTADGDYAWTAYVARRRLTEALSDYVGVDNDNDDWHDPAERAALVIAFVLALLTTLAYFTANPATPALIAATWTITLIRLGAITYWNRYADPED
jgi:hypothetical protein